MQPFSLIAVTVLIGLLVDCPLLAKAKSNEERCDTIDLKPRYLFTPMDSRKDVCPDISEVECGYYSPRCRTNNDCRYEESCCASSKGQHVKCCTRNAAPVPAPAPVPIPAPAPVPIPIPAPAPIHIGIPAPTQHVIYNIPAPPKYVVYGEVPTPTQYITYNRIPTPPKYITYHQVPSPTNYITYNRIPSPAQYIVHGVVLPSPTKYTLKKVATQSKFFVRNIPT